MLGLFLSFAAYSLIENELKRCFPTERKKIINNFLASFHIFLLFVFFLLYEVSSHNNTWLEYIKFNTCGYFFYDALTIIKHRQFSKFNIFMLYHHIILGIYFLHKSDWEQNYLLK